MIKITDYYADWCGPCKIMAPILDELLKEFPNVTVEKVNIDDNLERVQKAGVMSVPTFVIEKDGEVTFRESGIVSKERLATHLS